WRGRCWRRLPPRAGSAGKNDASASRSHGPDIPPGEQVAYRRLQRAPARLAVDPAADNALCVDEHGLRDPPHAVALRGRAIRGVEERGKRDTEPAHERAAVGRKVLIADADHAQRSGALTLETL